MVEHQKIRSNLLSLTIMKWEHHYAKEQHIFYAKKDKRQILAYVVNATFDGDSLPHHACHICS